MTLQSSRRILRNRSLLQRQKIGLDADASVYDSGASVRPMRYRKQFAVVETLQR